MRIISLTQGYTVLVDDADFEELNKRLWYVLFNPQGMPYAATGRRKARVLMHTAILPAKIGFETDHINRNTLDNQRHNLRYATHSQNISRKRSTNKTGYRGVYLVDRPRPFRAIFDGKHLGYFNTAEEAAHAYDAQSEIVRGEFAVLNRNAQQ